VEFRRLSRSIKDPVTIFTLICAGETIRPFRTSRSELSLVSGPGPETKPEAVNRT
jgi:hypothetical protein